MFKLSVNSKNILKTPIDYSDLQRLEQATRGYGETHQNEGFMMYETSSEARNASW